VKLASDLYASWLREAGVRVDLPEGELVELSPLLGATGAQLKGRIAAGARVPDVTGGRYLE
jgi:hypothetical protein